MENEKFFEIKDLVVKFGPPKRRNAVLKGKHIMISVIRMITLSTTPPYRPAMEPSSTPMTSLNMVAKIPTLIDTRPPQARRVRISRPSSSVPSRCCAVGALSIFIMSMVSWS